VRWNNALVMSFYLATSDRSHSSFTLWYNIMAARASSTCSHSSTCRNIKGSITSAGLRHWNVWKNHQTQGIHALSTQFSSPSVFNPTLSGHMPGFHLGGGSSGEAPPPPPPPKKKNSSTAPHNCPQENVKRVSIRMAGGTSASRTLLLAMALQPCNRCSPPRRNS
jgi:hypothetical protein